MAEWKLKCGTVVLIDDCDFERLRERAWFISRTGYVYRRTETAGKKRFTVLMHRIICGLEHGDKRNVDHINGNRLDNRRENLRICTREENMHNRLMYRNNTSGFKGVTWSKSHRKWRAQIGVNGKKLNLGGFDNPELAHLAYCEAAKKMHGEFYNPGYVPHSKEPKGAGE